MKENPHYLARAIVFVCLIILISMLTRSSNDDKNLQPFAPGITSAPSDYVPLLPTQTPLELAQWYIDNKHYDSAIDCCSNILLNDPKNAEVYIIRATAHASKAFSQKRDELLRKAIDDLTKAIELDPQNAYAFTFRGNLLVHFKDWEGALKDYTCAIEIDPKCEHAYSGRSAVNSILGNKAAAESDSALHRKYKPDTPENRSTERTGRSGDLHSLSIDTWHLHTPH